MNATDNPNDWSEDDVRDVLNKVAQEMAEVAERKRLRYQEATKGAEKAGKALSDMLRGL
jgi:hypothetical protein